MVHASRQFDGLQAQYRFSRQSLRLDKLAVKAAGLSFDTRFDLKQALDLPCTTEWFSVPPAAPHGQIPKLGTLHPSVVRAVQAACRAATG